MPGSIGSGSFCSRRSSPDAGPRFDPFLVLDGPHKEHFRSTSIVRLPDSDKVFCPICLELRSSEDVGGMENEAYHRYVSDLFDILERYGEDENLRKIVLTILDIFLSKRVFVLDRDDHYHRMLRVLYRLMKSDLYNMNEFVLFTKIMSRVSIHSIQPIPLKSTWEAWRRMLDYGKSISFGSLIDQDSQNIPSKLVEFLIAQSLIVQSYLGLINHVAQDKISDLVFTTHRHKQEPLTSKYYETSQSTCLKFIQERLFQNCECILMREVASSPLELRAVSEIFSALRECLINAISRNDEQFLGWLKEKDVIKVAHRISQRNPTNEHRTGIMNFLKKYVQYHLEKEYGTDQHLDTFIAGIDSIETAASKVVSTKNDSSSKIGLFYLLINWVAIKLNSGYYVSGRVGSILLGSSGFIDTIQGELTKSRFFIRVFAYVVASSIDHTSSQIKHEGIGRVHRFFKDDLRDIYAQRRLADFRITYCHEINVFEWVHVRKDFIKLTNCKAIEYLIDRGIEQNNLISVLKILLKRPLREPFCRYIKRDAKTMFEKILPVGISAFDAHIMSEFSSWLPALLQEMVLRLKSNLDPEKRLNLTNKLNNLLSATNLLLSHNQKPEFSPYFCNQFIIDLTSIMEKAFNRPERSPEEIEFLIEAHEFMALIMETSNLCVMKLVQHFDFTLVGYMYHCLDNYRTGDGLGEAIAHVLVAYDNLDYPLRHRLDRSLLYQMSSSSYEWMMSANTDLHMISLILVEKFYPPEEAPGPNHMNLLDTAKACLVTGFLHMLCAHSQLMEDELQRIRILSILKYDDFKYHPLYPQLLERTPKLRADTDMNRELGPPSPDLSFASAGDFEEEQISVSRILEQLNEDEGYKSASTMSLPRNIYLSKVVDEVSSDYPGTQEWERRAFEQTQSINVENEGNVQT